MNEARLGNTQSARTQNDTRQWLMKLPPALFRARLQVDSGVALFPSAFAPGQLAVRPARAMLAGELIFCIDAHAGWFTSETEAEQAGCDLAASVFWREEFVRSSLGGRVSQRRILAAEPGQYLWPHLHFLPQDSPCEANCVVREDFSKGAHPTSISVCAACDLEPFEQELFVCVAVTPWARARDHQRRDAQAMRNTGGEEAGEAKSESEERKTKKQKMKKEKTRSETDEEKIDEKNNESMPEGDEETEDDEEEEQREEGEVGQQYGKPTIGGSPSTDVRNDAFAGGSGEDPSGAQHSEGVRSSDGTRASGTKMVCEVEGLDMIWRNEQAELQFPADAPDDAPKQVPANTRVCLVGSIADDGKGHSLVPLASAPPTEYGGPVFEFELNAKSMIVTDESAKPLKLSKWWLDLPNDDAGDNAGAVWWHQASLDDDNNFTIATVDNPPAIISNDISHPMQLAPGFKTLWSLRWDEAAKCHKPYQLYVYTTKKCVVSSSSSICVYRSHSLPVRDSLATPLKTKQKGGNARKRSHESQGARKRKTQRTAGKPDDRSVESG